MTDSSPKRTHISEEQLQAMAGATARENQRLREALKRIRDELGHVCDDYAMCRHRGCRDSHAAWEVADAALKAPTDFLLLQRAERFDV